MEKSVQPETIYTNDEDEYIQKTFNDKSLTFMQVEQSFEERFKRHLNYSILLSRNEYLLEEANQATNNIAISQRASVEDPEGIIEQVSACISEPNKRQKTDISDSLKLDYENIKKENANLKLENKRIISNAAERLKILSERQARINLNLKNENIRLNAELKFTRDKLNSTIKLMDDEKSKMENKNDSEIDSENKKITDSLNAALSKSMSQLKEIEDKYNYLGEELERLKNENLILKIEKDKALGYAYHYVKKLKDFENSLIKERLCQNRSSYNFYDQKKIATDKVMENGYDKQNNTPLSSTSSTSSMFLSLPQPFSSSENYHINVNEFFGRPIINISEANGNTNPYNCGLNNNKKSIELNTEESQFLKKYMLRIENELKNYLENSIKSYYANTNQQQQE